MKDNNSLRTRKNKTTVRAADRSLVGDFIPSWRERSDGTRSPTSSNYSLDFQELDCGGD